MLLGFLSSVVLADQPITPEMLSFVGDGKVQAGSQLLEDEQVGQLAPRHGVSLGGAGEARFEVAIPLPPARLAPAVGLTYDSSRGEHTWVARGWTLEHGLPRVRRVTGRAQVQAYGDLDSPWQISGGGFDGVLHLVNGEWVYSGTTGTTEASVVWTDEILTVSVGGITTFLRPPVDLDSSVEPLEYQPVQQLDAAGNAIHLTWSGTRLHEIEYGSRCTTPSVDCSVQFGPEGQHGVNVSFYYALREDVSVFADQGRVERRDAALTEIVVTSDGEERRYQVSTELGEAGRQLHRVTLEGSPRPLGEFGYTGWDDAIPHWAPTGEPTRLRRTVGESPTVDSFSRFHHVEAGLYDFTGDGFPELYATGEIPEYLRRLPGEHDPSLLQFEDQERTLGLDLEPPLQSWGIEKSVVVQCDQSLSQTIDQVLTLDLDGDGVLDRVGSTYAPYEIAVPVDGDQVPDPCSANIGFGSGPFGWSVQYGRDGGLESAEMFSAPVRYPRVGAPVQGHFAVAPPVGQYVRDGSVELVDMNGDGWRDVVVFGPSVQVFLKRPSRSEGWESSPVAWAPGPVSVGMGDVNARDHEMASAAVTVTLHRDDRSSGWQALESYTFSGLRDMNGDGCGSSDVRHHATILSSANSLAA